MTNRYVYLAGPMSHLPYDKARSWRAALLEKWVATYPPGHPDWDWGVGALVFLDPLRGLETTYGKDATIYDKGEFPATAEYGRQRDMMDIRRSSFVVVGGLETPNRVSIGTMMELGMAMAWGVPIIVQAAYLHGTIHDHPWISSGPQFRTRSTEETVQLLRYLVMEGISPPTPDKDSTYGDLDLGPSAADNVVAIHNRLNQAKPDTVRDGDVATRVADNSDGGEARLSDLRTRFPSAGTFCGND